MPFRPLLRSLALPFAAGLLCLGLACKGKKDEAPVSSGTTKVFLTGKVTFDRIPVVRDSAGLPLGLETDPTKFLLNQPARYVRVVLYEEYTITENSQTKVFYRVPSGGEIYTLPDGTYAFEVYPNTNYMVEVQGSMTVGSGSNFINLTADPNGMASTTPVLNRLHYCFRQDLAGNKPSTAAGVNHVAASSIKTDTTVNIHIGVSDPWFLADTSLIQNSYLPTYRVAPSYSPGSPDYAYAGQAESTASGSKILAVLDSIATFSTCEGIASSFFGVLPSGNHLDLNYLPGQSDPHGNQVEFNRSTYPLVPGPTQQSVAYDSNLGITRYLGTLNGNPDAGWDEGEIFLLMARCNIFSQFATTRFYLGDAPDTAVLPPVPIDQALPHLHPNLALIEGLPELMAALVQKNPYLGLAGRDVRDLSSVAPSDRTIYSAPLVKALGWEAALLEHGITSPGTPTDWSKIKINNMRSFLVLVAPSSSSDTQNLYLQLKALASAGTTAAGVNPSSIFTDAAIRNLLASAPLSVPTGNIPWPRPGSGPLADLSTDLGADPTGLLPDFTLSMSASTQVNGHYPNLTPEELRFASFTQTGIKQYKVSVALLNGGTPIALSGGEVELTFISQDTPSGTLVKSFLLQTSTPTPLSLTLEGRPNVVGAHAIRLRMHSPTTLQPDTTVRITLTPQS